MAQSSKGLLTLVLIIAVRVPANCQVLRFFADDPIQAMPAPLPVEKPLRQNINDNLDFLSKSTSRTPPTAKPAGAINTLGEVPDSEWFTNRHAKRRMSRAELQRGPAYSEAPVAPFTVTGGKTQGITPGFRMKDSQNRTYFVKVDPLKYPELSTGSDVIVSRFLYAIGYNTPDNEIVDLTLQELLLSSKAVITPMGDQPRKMTWNDIEQMVMNVPHYTDGSFRIIASLAAEGDSVGPFQYEGTRTDDPNDIVPHEDRRDLRGLNVIYAWVNNTDAKASNTLDTVVNGNGTRFIRHYLLDFGSALGSDGDAPKDARYGYEFLLPTPIAALTQILSLGVWPAPWERVHYPDLRAVGNFESQSFDPEGWKPHYPNPAFMSSLPDDDYWAAKQVMAFTDDDIRAIVETAKFTDPRSTEYIVKTLAERRDKIGRVYFSKVLPLDHFHIENQELVFDDLGVQYGFQSARSYQVRWSEFDNIHQQHTPIPGNGSARLPQAAAQAVSGSYFSAVIVASGDPRKTVSVYLRKEGSSYKVVGIDRTW
jgi:hypothetical protein